MFTSSKIKSITPLGKQKVCDISVEDDESYIGNGIINHNCRRPNLQNIPRDSTASDIKRMFIPPPGYLLVEVDYSQAELRVVAELAQDKAMIDIFKRNYNIHTATACKMFKGNYDEVKALLKEVDKGNIDPQKDKNAMEWVKRKKIGKSLNFSILYMQGDEATAETLGCSIQDASKFKKEWFNQFPQVAEWMKKQIKHAKKHGYVYNMFGRKRRLYNIYSEKDFLRAEAERQSVNAPIQGTAGDFTTFSQVIIREKIRSGEFPIDMVEVYTVHDSIGYYIRPKDIHKVMPKIIEICDNPQTKEFFGFELEHVQMKVSPETGYHWGALREYDPNFDYIKEYKEWEKGGRQL